MRAVANKTGATLLGYWNLAPELLELQVCGVVLIFQETTKSWAFAM